MGGLIDYNLNLALTLLRINPQPGFRSVLIKMI